MTIYENLVIGNFLFALGLKIGARRHDVIAPDLAVHLTQQTPLDYVLGDVLLAGPRAVALLEFKRAADRRRKETDKLAKIEHQLKHPEFQALQTISQQIHFYVETEDTLNKDLLNKDFARVLRYLDLKTDKRRSSLGELVDDLASRARSAPELPEMYIRDCQQYLELVCLCQGRSYYACPGLLVGVGGDARIAFAPLDDIRDLKTTLAEIRQQEINLARRIIRVQREQLAERVRLRHAPSRSQGLER